MSLAERFLVGPINPNIASALLGAGSSAGKGIDASILTAWAQARAGVGAAGAPNDPNAPLAPVWTPGVSPAADVLIERALARKAFFDTGAKLYADLGATGDYRRLFALYSGLTTLHALAGRVESDALAKPQRAETIAAFSRGMTELEAFLEREQFEDVRLAQGDRVDAAQSTVAIPAPDDDYVTDVIHKGGIAATFSGIARDAEFEIQAISAGGATQTIAISLADLGGLSRSLANIVNHANGKLAAAGVASRLEIVDRTPKTTTMVVGGRAIESRYLGPRQYALKVDVRAGERIAFEPTDAAPAFYALGDAATGARLIKLSDIDGAPGEPVRRIRPAATQDPIGAHVATGWLGPGAPYASAPAGAYEQRTGALVSPADGASEAALRAAGEAVLKLHFANGRSMTLSTAWRSDDLEAWRTRPGESSDRALLDDLAERLTQLLHEQGVAAGVDVWESGGELGLSVLTGDFVSASNLTLGGRAIALQSVDPAGMIGGLRGGVFARRFEAGAIGPAGMLFSGAQSFVFTLAGASHTLTIDGGSDGVDAATFTDRLNEKLRALGIAAAASLEDVGGALALRVDAMHDLVDVRAVLNGAEHDAALLAPGAWANGGLPNTSAGLPFAESTRSYVCTAPSPLAVHSGALDIAVEVETPSGIKTVNLSVSAQERVDNPDPAPGEWSAPLQARLDRALNEAGVYVSAASPDLRNWAVAEGAGQRLVAVRINGDALALSGAPPSISLGGAHSAERSFTGDQAASSTSAEVAALVLDPAVGLIFDTVWGPRSVSATLQPSDARTLESAALRLNEALASQGYDLGVAAVDLSGAGAGLRIVSGASRTVRDVAAVIVGGISAPVSLDAIDAYSRGDDPPGSIAVAERAARGAGVLEVLPGASPYATPSANAAAWFPGRAFDVSVGGGAGVATARAVATGADGAVYVIADLSRDSATIAVKGARDVALFKYDSAGKLSFTQVLGAAQSASGFSLAVSAQGVVAVAGSVEGALSGAGAARGGADSFVTLFDAAGGELWTARRGAAADDRASAIAFAPDGSVIVAGKTDSALGNQATFGGADGYVRGYSSTGAELFTRQFGTAGADAASALLVRSDGAGGAEIFVGGVENNRGVLRRFTYSHSAGLSAGPSRDIGNFADGGIAALAADGTALYVAGQAGADRLALGAPAVGAVAGREGFVARVDASLASNGMDRATYLGSVRDDAAAQLAIVGGAVYVAGNAGGVVAGENALGGRAPFLARLDAAGRLAWLRSFHSASGALTLTGLAVDGGGASPLDALGLPRGAIPRSSSVPLVDRSALRAGDELRIGADGSRLATIIVRADDTLGSLAMAVNRAIGAAGRAEIVRENGADRLAIRNREGHAIRLEPGRGGRDALPALGWREGVVAENGKARGDMKTFGLGLIASDLRLDDKAAIAATRAKLSAAISMVRQAYETLLNPNAKELSAEEKALEARRQAAAGAVPPLYSAQLANYRAALARLGGG